MDDTLDNRVALQKAAITLGMSRESVLRRLGSGDLDGGQDSLSGRWYVTQDSLDRYLVERQAAATS